MDLISKAVRGLGNEVLTGLTNAATVLVQDGGRNGLPFPTCHENCMENGKFDELELGIVTNLYSVDYVFWPGE